MNTNDTCRLCLEKLAEAGGAVPLRDDSFQAAIKRVFPFEFNLDSNLPEYACSVCSQRVWKFNSFGEFVENNQRKLQQEHPVMQSADNAPKVVNSEHASGSIVEKARIVRDEDRTAVRTENCSSELELDIEVGKYELQEQQNEESVSVCHGMDVQEDETEYTPALGVQSINQSKEGSKQGVAEPPKNTNSAYESQQAITPGDTASVRKNNTCAIESFGIIEIDDNELQELENEILESVSVDEHKGNSIVQKTTDPEEALKSTAKNNETENRSTYSCVECKHVFTKKRQFAKHKCMEWPTNDEHHQDNAIEKETDKKGSFPCGLCNRTFRTYVQCKDHRYAHKITKCPICGIQIGRKQLKQHIDAHDDAFRCDICDLSLASSWSLGYHKSTFHPDEKNRKSVECPICSKQVLKSAFKQHTAVHEGAFRCTVCGRNLSSAWKLRRHHNSFHSNQKQKQKKLNK